MKLSEGYLLKEIVDSYVLVPVGQQVVDQKSIMHINKTGYFIASLLQQEISYDEILERMIEEYQAEKNEESILKQDLDQFLLGLKEKQIIID